MEQLPRDPETIEQDLTDITERTQRQLATLAESSGTLNLRPENLFVVAPGREVSWTDYIDNGCRGGWSEQRRSTLDSAPYEITELNQKYRRFTAELSRDGKHVGSLGLNAEAIGTTTFFERASADTEGEISSAADGFIRNWSTGSYKHIHRISEYFNDRYDVIASPKSPLENPLQLRSRDRVEALRHEIESIELMTNNEGTYAKLHLVSSYPRPTTDWIPLEHLRFDLRERDPKAVLNQRLFRTATRLLAYYDSAPIHKVDRQAPQVDEINELLSNSILPIKYEPDTGVHERFYEQPLFVIATPTETGVENVRRVTGARDIFERPYVSANKLRSSDSSLWVMDESSDLAVPFTQATLSVKKPDYSYDIHLTDYLLKGKK